MLAILAAASPDTLLLSNDPQHPLPESRSGYRPCRPAWWLSPDRFTYAFLLHRLVEHPNKPIPPGIKRDIQEYYVNPDAPISTKKDPQVWAQVQADLKILAGMPTSTEPQLYPDLRRRRRKLPISPSSHR